MAKKFELDLRAGHAPTDDLSREVYGVFGLPLDAHSVAGTIRVLDRAVAERRRCFWSTPNIHFLVKSLKDREFRETLETSDLCTIDGKPVLWLARLLGYPLKETAAGSDVWSSLRRSGRRARTRVFYFGGPEGRAESACANLNASGGGLFCCGWSSPGFGSVEELSRSALLEEINRANADLLTVSLGAEKGQRWLKQNQDVIQAPVRVHLGAVVNFDAGQVKRAPAALRRVGLEWLWRIKEEPKLWSRYALDGLVLARLLVANLAPLLLLQAACFRRKGPEPLCLHVEILNDRTRVRMTGQAIAESIDAVQGDFRTILEFRRSIELDWMGVTAIDSRFAGFLLMLRKQLGPEFEIKHRNVSRRIRFWLKLNKLQYLLAS